MRHQLLINGRYATRPITGVERYARDLTRCLADRGRLVRPPFNAQGLVGHLWEQLVLPMATTPDSCLWSPANTGPLLVPNQVVSIHDLAPLDHPEWYNGYFAAFYQFLLPRLVQRVRRIITDSQFSRQRLMDRLNLEPEKVKVIPPGIDIERFKPAAPDQIAEVHARYAIHTPYLFFLGTLQPRKNLARLLKAWHKVQPYYPEVELLIGGGSSSSFKSPHITPLPPGARRLGRIQEVDLAAFYTGSLGVIIPSLYEGFCMVGLEAFACGGCVLASDLPVFREVLGEAAIYFDSHSIQALANCLESFLNHPEKGDHFAKLGRQRLKMYSLKRSAEMVFEVCSEG